MNPPCCCRKNRRVLEDARHQISWFARARKLVGLIVPGAVLALLPKCPMCLAAYVALGTGFTMSYASAQILMRTLTVLCIATVALCVGRRLLSYMKQGNNFQPTKAQS